MSDAAPSIVPGDAPVGGDEALSPQAIDRVLADFRLWLEAVAGQESFGPPPTDEDGPGVDLATLVGQFTALRHEVNLQTRASRGQMEQGAQALEQLSQSLTTLQRQQAVSQEKTGPKDQQDDAIRPILKSLLDAHDSLRLAEREVQRFRDALEKMVLPESTEPSDNRSAESARAERVEVSIPLWMRVLGLGARIERSVATLQSRWEDAQAQALERQRVRIREREKRQELIHDLTERIRQSVQSILTGYGMSLDRLERTLGQHGLEPIDAVGSLFDPEQMEALEVMTDSARRSGEVVEEVRRGYLWRGKVFRFAQVKVARN